jgi:hypothetical protein
LLSGRTAYERATGSLEEERLKITEDDKLCRFSLYLAEAVNVLLSLS